MELSQLPELCQEKWSLSRKQSKNIKERVDLLIGNATDRVGEIELLSDSIVIPLVYKEGEIPRKKVITGFEEFNYFDTEPHTIKIVVKPNSIEYAELFKDGDVKEKHSMVIEGNNPFNISFKYRSESNNIKNLLHSMTFELRINSRGEATITSDKLGEMPFDEFLRLFIGDEVVELDLPKYFKTENIYKLLGDLASTRNIHHMISRCDELFYVDKNYERQQLKLTWHYFMYVLRNSDKKRELEKRIARFFDDRKWNKNDESRLLKLSVEELESLLPTDEEHYKDYCIIKNYLKENKEWEIEEFIADDKEDIGSWITIVAHSCLDEDETRELSSSTHGKENYVVYTHNGKKLPEDAKDQMKLLTDIGYIDENGNAHLNELIEAIYCGRVDVYDDIKPVEEATLIKENKIAYRQTGRYYHEMRFEYVWHDNENLYKLVCTPIPTQVIDKKEYIMSQMICELYVTNIVDSIMHKDSTKKGTKQIAINSDLTPIELIKGLCDGAIQNLGLELYKELKEVEKVNSPKTTSDEETKYIDGLKNRVRIIRQRQENSSEEKAKLLQKRIERIEGRINEKAS